MALPPVACVNCAALTAIAGLTLFVLLGSVTSLAVTVKLPLLLKNTGKICVPATSAVLAGKVAVGSVELKPTVSVTLVATFQLLSTALTVTLNPLNALCALGVPVLPVGVPGAVVSPGTSSCNFVNAAAPTTMLPEVALVRPLLVNWIVIVFATLCDRLA